MTMTMTNNLLFRHICPYSMKYIYSMYNVKTVMEHQEKQYKFYNHNLSSLFQYICILWNEGFTISAATDSVSGLGNYSHFCNSYYNRLLTLKVKYKRTVPPTLVFLFNRVLMHRHNMFCHTSTYFLGL